MSPALRLSASLVVGLSGMAATLVGALPGVAAGLLLLLDYSLGGSLDVVRALVAGLLWPQAGIGLLHRQALLLHPVAAGLWSLAAASLGLAGTAMALAEWREGRPGWRASLPAWALAAGCGGVPVAVLLAPAVAVQLVGLIVRRHAATLSGFARPPALRAREPLAALPAPGLDASPLAARVVTAAGLPAGGNWRAVSVADPARQAAALALLGEDRLPGPGEHLALFTAAPPGPVPVTGDVPPPGDATATLLRAAAAAGLALRPVRVAGGDGLAAALAVPPEWRPVAYLVPSGGTVPVLRR